MWVGERRGSSSITTVEYLEMLPGNCIHYNLEEGVLRISGRGHASTLLHADKRFESCVDDAHGEAEVAVELGDGCIFRSPPGRCCICLHCGTVVRRHDGARHTHERVPSSSWRASPSSPSAVRPS